MTDCSITWKDTEGRTYCFKNADRKATFLKDAPANLERARTFVAADGVLSTEKAMQYFDGSDAETLVKAHIAAVTAANRGTFPLEDSLTGEHLVLAFDGVDFTRTIDGYGFFPDVNFHVKDESSKKYTVDFWIVPEAGSKDQIYDIDFWLSEKDGKLSIEKTLVHKVPELKNGQWVQVPRYSFKDLGSSKVVP